MNWPILVIQKEWRLSNQLRTSGFLILAWRNILQQVRPIIMTTMKFVYSAKRTSDLMINMLIQISHEIVKMLAGTTTLDRECLYTYEFWLSLCKIVRSSVILLLLLFILYLQRCNALWYCRHWWWNTCEFNFTRTFTAEYIVNTFANIIFQIKREYDKCNNCSPPPPFFFAEKKWTYVTLLIIVHWPLNLNSVLKIEVFQLICRKQIQRETTRVHSNFMQGIKLPLILKEKAW
jgi:hypothetical protein